MELSIIVPVYNMAADGKLEYCLDSLLNQTISDYEIIAVDDASTDNSPQILLDYAANYPDVFKVYFSPAAEAIQPRRLGFSSWVSFHQEKRARPVANWEKTVKKTRGQLVIMGNSLEAVE